MTKGHKEYDPKPTRVAGGKTFAATVKTKESHKTTTPTDSESKI